MDNLLANKQNSLSLIRIIAALQVMMGHLIEHFELPGNEAALHATYFFRGVPIFFVISGFLMWFSIGRSQSYVQYLKKRFWRIYPELWVSVVIDVVVLVVLYHGYNVNDLVLFAFCQGTLFQFWTPNSLRGYGVGTPNGALWTIGVMIQYYIIAYWFYKLMKNRRLIVWVIGFIASLAICIAGIFVAHNLIHYEIIGKLYDQTIIKYFYLFYIGMFVAKFNDRIMPVLMKYWYAFLIIAAVFFWSSYDIFLGYYLFWSLFLTIGLIGFAYRFPMLSVNPDISYGLFLYHMIVVNIFVNFGWIGSWIFVIPVVLIVSLFAYASTITFGRISVKKKKNI